MKIAERRNKAFREKKKKKEQKEQTKKKYIFLFTIL